MDSMERQFVRLVQLVLDGVATDTEHAELARLSAANPELVTAVVDELMIDALLKWQSGSIIEELPFLEGSVTRSHDLPMRRSRKAISLWTGIIAATLLVATGLVAWMSTGTRADDLVIADIVHQHGVTWSDDCTALAASNTVRRGRLSCSSGEYTLRFRDGSTVQVQGPASLEIKSKRLVQLDQGQATANVAHGSTGFTITCALVDVVDQGTEFGISVDSGRADVVVFDGKVDVKSNLGQSDTPKRLIRGEAVKVDRQGTFGRLADIRRDVDGRWWSGDRPNADRNVIARVTDNIGGSAETYVCYQTTYQGLHDDALAYSDNPYHQWNGLTAAGLPSFLRGADYIRTFNHYRYMEYFKMTIEFSKPANLSVFADNRIPPPAWLVEQFEDTGVDIGLDEGPWLDNIPPEYREFDVNTTAVGAGKSIDNVFSVWRRRCADGKPVTLGDAGAWGGEGGQGRAMYGVAATPLDTENVADKALKSLDGT
jgi:ferric-dicitrate binding protein FerR (iron transport regulator)